jgi:hypothetical protein
MKLVIYTAVFGDYDAVRSPRQPIADDVDLVCFTDRIEAVPPGWRPASLPPEAAGTTPAARNRWLKMHPHLLFPAHDASVYLDGNIEVVGAVQELAAHALSGGPLSMYDHPFRNCLYDEAVACAWVGLDWLDPIAAHVERYARDGFPRRHGLFEANVIVRRHHDQRVVRAMQRWWREWDQGIKRDQLSLTYALWREELAVNSLGRHDPRFVQRYFAYRRHRQPWRGLPSRLLRRYLNRLRIVAGGGRDRFIRQQVLAGASASA